MTGAAEYSMVALIADESAELTHLHRHYFQNLVLFALYSSKLYK